MPIQKFRSIDDMPEPTSVQPGTPEHVQRFRAALQRAALFGAPFPPGVFKYPSIEAAQREREAWVRARRTEP